MAGAAACGSVTSQKADLTARQHLTSLRLTPLDASFGLEIHGLTAAALHAEPAAARALLRRALAASKGLLLFRDLRGWKREDMVALSEAFGTVEASPPDGPFDALLEGDGRVHTFSKVPSARVFDVEEEAPTAALVEGVSAADTEQHGGRQ
eukprot:3179264-Prymnesium_polylepis.1